MNEIERIESALSHISADDRATWLSVGAALKSDLGEDGYIIWERWSRGSEKFDSHRIMVDWRSLKSGLIHMGTIYHLARKHGWVASHSSSDGQQAALRQKPRRQPPPPPAETPPDVISAMKRRIAASSLEAGHPYLADHSLGQARLPDHQALVYRSRLQQVNGNLVIPLWLPGRKLTSIQTITAAGEKKFWPKAVVSRAFHELGARGVHGRRRGRIICEGFRDALHIVKALKVLQVPMGVTVAFSAANILKVSGRWDVIVADNDESGTGEKYARKTGLKWWMPDEVGMDVTDLVRKYGTEFLVHELRGLL